MPNIENVCSRIDAYSDRLSNQVRTLAVGLLAFAGGLIATNLTGDKAAPKIPGWLLERLFFIGVAALLALAFDLAQYGSMYLYMRTFQKRLDREIKDTREKQPDFEPQTLIRDYNESDLRFLAGRIFFGLKSIILFAAVLWLTIDAFVLLKTGTGTSSQHSKTEQIQQQVNLDAKVWENTEVGVMCFSPGGAFPGILDGRQADWEPKIGGR